jgi:hypothetical protein
VSKQKCENFLTMYLFSLKKCLNSNSVDASDVFMEGTFDDPVWQGPEPEHEW